MGPAGMRVLMLWAMLLVAAIVVAWVVLDRRRRLSMQTRPCGKCSRPNPAVASYCRHCGQRLA